MGFAIDNLARLFIGLQGESNARMIDIDMSEWMRDWPDAKVDVLVQRPGEDETYPVETKLRGGHLLWTPKREDVLIAGMGKAQIILTDKNDVELRSRVVQTIIGESIAGTEGEAPDPEQGWVHQVLQAANEVKAQVDVGTGNGLYIVNQRKDDQSKADRTAEEIQAAVSAGKTVLLRTVGGEVYSLCVNLGPNLYFTNVRPGLPGNLNGYGLTVKTAIMTEGDGIQLRSPTNGTLSPNPYKLRLTGAVEAEYDGSKEIVVDIPAGSATPSETVILPETELTEIDAGSGQFVLWRKPEKALVSGDLYKVVYNGTPFELVAAPLEGEPAHALGNMALIGIGADTGEPFVVGIIDTPVGGDNAPGLVVVNDGSATITMSISEISTPGNASTPQHTITINEDGSVTSSATFEELARMTDAQIQSSVTVVWTDTYSGVPVSMTSAIDRVTRMVASEEGVEWLQLRFAVMADFIDSAYTSEATRYVEWLKSNGAPTVPNRHTQSLPHMTHWDKGTAYMRYNGERWEPVGIDQMRQDLGIGGGAEPATTDVFYTADGQIFNTVDEAVLHVQKGDS